MADELRTDRLLLRRASLDDVEPMHRIMSDPAAMRFWSTPPHADVDETLRWMISMIEVDPAASDDFIITFDGAVIGKLGAWRLPEVGFLIARSHWGWGFGREAMAAFIGRRRRLGSTELTADVDPRNSASLRLLERHGFVETGRSAGTWQVGDELCDSVNLRLVL
jgi:RimJ/RimL family protein N-acetyltransferase